MKSDIEKLKYLFQIEDNGGIKGKWTCVQPMAINKITVLFIPFGLGKGKLKI